MAEPTFVSELVALCEKWGVGEASETEAFIIGSYLAHMAGVINMTFQARDCSKAPPTPVLRGDTPHEQ